MAKNNVFRIRLDDDELRDLERQAAALKRPAAEYARALLFADRRPAQSVDFSAIERRIDRVESALAASAAAFDQLLSQLRELVRVPTFREFRGRAAAEGVTQRQGEDDIAYLRRVADAYFLQYRIWPDIQETRTFGPVPDRVDKRAWPTGPSA